MCFYNRKKLKQLEQNLDVIVMEHKEEYNKVCMLSGRIVRAIELLEENIPIWEECHWDGSDIDIENPIRELLKILRGEDNE